MKIYIGSDHAGTTLKQAIIKKYASQYEFINCTSDDITPLNYAQCALDVATNVAQTKDSLGIVICGTGIGISIAANKVKGIRCALVYNETVAALAKEHNNANVIAFGARQFDEEAVFKMLDAFLNAQFAGARHQTRLNTIDAYEKEDK